MSRGLPRASERYAGRRGFSLVELMVAMVLGALVSAGIITLFVSVNQADNVQTHLARIQETARYAVSRMREDLQMSNALYCTNTGGVATSTSNYYQDQVRQPTVYSVGLDRMLPDQTAHFGDSGYPDKPTASYPMPAFMFMRGYTCTASSCSPSLDDMTDRTGNSDPLPSLGSSADQRVRYADVLSIRRLVHSGWSVASTGSSCSAGSSVTTITVVPQSGDSALSGNSFSAGLAMLGSCERGAEIFSVDGSASSASATVVSDAVGTSSGQNFDVPGCLNASSSGNSDDVRLFDFARDFQTVTYYIELQSDPNPDAPSGHLIATLMRRVNGGSDFASTGGSSEEIARGVERLDVRYQVEDDNGNTYLLSADQVDSGDSGALTCPAAASGTLSPDTGCLWRAVKAVEVHMLLDSVDAMPGLSDAEQAYAYSIDTPSAMTPTAPDDDSHTVKPSSQGLSTDMLRREFTAVISVRNYNP